MGGSRAGAERAVFRHPRLHLFSEKLAADRALRGAERLSFDDDAHLSAASAATIDKYIGDAIMAFIERGVDLNDHATRAGSLPATAGRAPQLNREFARAGWPEVKNGVGVNPRGMTRQHGLGIRSRTP